MNKVLYIILIFLFSLMVFSCSSDDTEKIKDTLVDPVADSVDIVVDTVADSVDTVVDTVADVVVVDNSGNGETTSSITYVAVGSSGTILTSDNGTTWTSRTSGTTKGLRDVIYANSKFVSVGASGTILTSDNGTTWTSMTSGTSNLLRDVIYANSKFVSVGASGTILTSDNGTTWTSMTSGTTKGLRSIAYGCTLPACTRSISTFVTVGES
jgi:hypothetical protein